MPTTLAALLVIVFAVLPGIPAYFIYRYFYGADWRKTELEKIIPSIVLSVCGVGVYIILSSTIGLPPPIYLLPSTFDSATLQIATLKAIAVPLIFHFLSSILVAIVAVLFLRIIRKWIPSTPYPSAWDDFIRDCVPNHWVVIKLSNGESYAGFIRNADISVCQSERDIVLGEPALYIDKEKNYKVLPYNQLFLPSTLISSIAVVSSKDDTKISDTEKFLFPKEKTNG